MHWPRSRRRASASTLGYRNQALRRSEQHVRVRHRGRREHSLVGTNCSAVRVMLIGPVAHIDAVQIEYSPFCLQPEMNGMLDACRELGVAVIAFSPLGAGFLTGKFTDPEQFKGDLRGGSPRFQGDAFQENLKLLKTFEGIAADKRCTSSQLALAWVAKQGAIPIPGTKSISRLEENWGARAVDLSDEDMVRIRECISVGVKGER